MSTFNIPAGLSSPRHIVFIFICLSLLIMLWVGHASLQGKVSGKVFVSDGEQLILLDRQENRRIAVNAIGKTAEVLLPVSSLDILEEPDVLETYAKYNEFLQRQTLLSSYFDGSTGSLFVKTADGELLQYPLRDRRISDLRAGFYVQIIAGFLCVLIASGIWAFNRRDIETQIYLLMGLGIAAACWSSAVYTSRELAVDGQLFRTLSLINHFGASAFGGGLVGLFAIYPCRLVSKPFAWLIVWSFLLVWLMDSLQLPQTTAAGFHMPLMVYVLLALAFAFAQWRATRKKAAERAVLKWLLLSVMGTTMIFTLMNIVPAALMETTLGAQSFTLAGFTLGVLLMALGLRRYKLFNLDRWWYQYWTWFFAGIAVLILDIALIGILHINQGLALGLSVAVVGWLYIPVRHRLWQWIRPGTGSGLQQLLPEMIKQLFAARTEQDVHLAWQNILQQAFTPLVLDAGQSVKGSQIDDNGRMLNVPSVLDNTSWQLCHAEKGARLFSARDVQLVEMMYELVVRASEAIKAREQGMLAERDRIRRDLHDDLGARLMSVMHSAELEQSQSQARQAIAELRSILNALEQAPCQLAEALDVWQMEMNERALQGDFELIWQQQLEKDVMLNARTRHNLGRVLRELSSNAIRHSGGDQIMLDVQYNGQKLLVEFSDNGCKHQSEAQQGQGMRIVESRMAELDGQVDWQTTETGACQVSIVIPLETGAK